MPDALPAGLAREARLEPLRTDDAAMLDRVMAIEAQAYSHPWTRGNFGDSLRSGYRVELLLAQDDLLGYFVAMRGVDEVHLLNLTVAPAWQRQGWARLMLQALVDWARAEGAQWLWLEVRQSNDRAQALYEAAGFRRVGLRTGYYPAGREGREDAVVMSMAL